MQEEGDEQKKVSVLQSAIAKKTEWDRLKKAVQRKKEDVEILSQRFPGDIPKTETVKKKISECGDMEKATERASMYRLSETEI